MITEMNDVGSTENERPDPQKAVCLEHTDAASFTGDRTVIPLEEAMQSAPVEEETVPTALGTREMLQGPNKEITDMKDGLENSDATEKILALDDGMDLSKSATNKETDFNMEEDDVVNAEEHNKQELRKAEKSCEMKNNPCTEMTVAPSLEVIHTDDELPLRELSELSAAWHKGIFGISSLCSEPFHVEGGVGGQRAPRRSYSVPYTEY